MRAPYLLRENIAALLRLRKMDASALAHALGCDKSWINKILNGHRGMPIKYLDAVADVLGVATYQLFQPGIAYSTERRNGRDRRQGQDRRISHAQRQMQAVAAELARVRKVRKPGKASET